MEPSLEQCRWPDLPERYDCALREAVRFILARFQVAGIIASGTIIRGHPDPASDLDLYVIHRRPFRQRLQRFFHGVPAEIFVNPPAAIERYLAREQADARPLTAHMLATGTVILDRDPVVEQLRQRARELLAGPPTLTPQEFTSARYMAACLFEDATDVAARDPETAAMLLGQAVVAMLHLLFRRSGRFVPRGKELLAEVEALDAEAGELARRFFAAPDLGSQLALAGRLADRIIGARGFFEWEAAPERVDG